MALTSISSATILQWLRLSAESFQQHKDELTALDAAIGDADHGANMARGFTAVLAKLDGLKDKDIGMIFKTTAMTLISTVGGASGPLYGTFFLQAATGAAGKMTLTQEELFAVCNAGLTGLMHRGKATVGEKTMLDALVPAIRALKPVDPDNITAALDRAVTAARKGAEATIPMTATKGRASYLGARSVGHMDPGASSSCLLLEALQQALPSSA